MSSPTARRSASTPAPNPADAPRATRESDPRLRTPRHPPRCSVLEVATGKVVDACFDRHRHQELLKFLKQVAKGHPRIKLHLRERSPDRSPLVTEPSRPDTRDAAGGRAEGSHVDSDSAEWSATTEPGRLVAGRQSMVRPASRRGTAGPRATRNRELLAFTRGGQGAVRCLRRPVRVLLCRG
jgi:hypothetical protein